MISSIVLFFRRAREEVGPVVEAPRLAAAALPFCVVPVAAGVAGFAPPRMELLAGAAVVVVAEVVVAEVVAAVLAAVVALVPKAFAVFAGSDVAALAAGLLRLPKRELGWAEAVVAVLVASAGLFRFAKGELEAAVGEAIGADVLLAEVAAAAPVGFAAWPKREEVPEEAGAAPVLGVAAGFAPNRFPGAEEPSAGFAPPNKFEAGFAAWLLLPNSEVAVVEAAG